MKILLALIVVAFSANAVEFDCEFGERSVFETLYTCKPVVTSLGSTTLDDVTGDHMPGKANEDVEALWIEDQILPFIPQGIMSYFENLIALTFFDNQMISISATDLQPFPLLQHFFSYGNKFASLDGDLFSFTPELTYIFLGYNEIQFIGPDLVTNLNNLQELHLQGNLCIDVEANTRAEVIELAPRLSDLCSPPTTTTTTEQQIEQCLCKRAKPREKTRMKTLSLIKCIQ